MSKQVTQKAKRVAADTAKKTAKVPAKKTVEKKDLNASTRAATSYTEKQEIKGYPSKLFIYKLEASPYWWVRYFVEGRVLRKTTKTSSKREAIEFAKKFYDTVTVNYQRGVFVNASNNFAKIVDAVLKEEEAKLDRREITKITYDNTEYRFKKHVLPYFREKDIAKIDYYMLADYLQYMSKQGISANTIRAYMQLVHKVLSHAARRKIITHVPEFPAIKVKDKPRGWFTTDEYDKLWKAASKLRNKRYEHRVWLDEQGEKHTQYIEKNAKTGKLGRLIRYIDMTEDIRRLIVFMVNSYIRPTDIKVMQHLHVDVVTGEHNYLRLRLPTTKGHSDPITTMGNAVKTYRKLCEVHAEKYEDKKIPSTDYVFMPQYKEKQRDYALQNLQRQFDVVLAVTGLGKDVNGESRTLYSLRHTCIMYRLLFGEGMNTLVLARNARTSVEMIDRFYAKPLSGEMNIEMLQSRRRKRNNTDKQ